MSMTGDRCIRGAFGTSLGATVAGSGSVNVSPLSFLHPYGSIVRLTAIPAAGSYFALWGSAASGTNNPLRFTITNATATISSLFATLPAGQFSLAVISDGSGEVNLSPQANRYGSGQSVSLTAVPEAGQTFIGWSGEATGTANPLILTMDNNKMITANFTKRPRLTIPDCFGFLGDDRVRLLLTDEVGSPYSIETSPDLQQWSSIAIITNALGVIQIDAPRSSNARQEFYRARSVTP